MPKTRSEDTLILFALTPGITSMTPVYNALTLLSNLKKDGDSSSRFNIIFFQEDGPNYLENFTLNAEYIVMALKSLEPVIVKGNVGGGIFLGISIIIDVFKKVSEKSFRLIILTDSGTPKIAKLYMPILETMIDQIKGMPFFIDIVRIDVEDQDLARIHIYDGLQVRPTSVEVAGIYHQPDVVAVRLLHDLPALRQRTHRAP